MIGMLFNTWNLLINNMIKLSNVLASPVCIKSWLVNAPPLSQIAVHVLADIIDPLLRSRNNNETASPQLMIRILTSNMEMIESNSSHLG